MKKLITVLLFVTLCASFIAIYESYAFSGDQMPDGNIAYATTEEGVTTCYSSMSQVPNQKALECNTPCCYRMDYFPGTAGGTCNGSTFNSCSD